MLECLLGCSTGKTENIYLKSFNDNGDNDEWEEYEMNVLTHKYFPQKKCL